ncbi:Zn finger family DNA binding protein [Mycena alexandri]|uniref:Zn finger family DNA binding protein n=1 Tax=Mycena alexandri TaxID=1745969 RepID=A0AAD6TC17_9AGAR|nr:Zn finger family DNA binding protein [Mycena alexandri]
MLSHQHPPSLLPRLPFDLPADPQAVPRSSHFFLDELTRLVADGTDPVSRPSSGTVEDDPPLSPSGPNYHYLSRNSRSPPAIYDSNASYAAPYPYSNDLRRAPSFRAPSPAPIDAPQPLSAPHAQDRFPISAYPTGTRLDSLPDRQPRYGLLPKISTNNILDQRRMSEPAVPYLPHAAPRAQPYSFNNYDEQSSPHSPESPYLSRVGSLGSLRHDYSPSVTHSDWKQDVEEHHHLDVSPFQPFASGISGSPPLQYAVRGEDTYGPSPPGTSTSSSSTAPAVLPTSSQGGQGDSPDPSNKKTYSFVALPGNAVRKRPRRRYDEIERLYHCKWPDCNKAYGTLNHLNAHVQMQKHGAKRSPNEFKELRKQWRKAKKEYESPALGPIRRSMSLRRDDLYHGHPYSGGHHRSFSHNSALSPPLSVSIPQLRQDASYGVDHLRYAPDSRGEIDAQSYGAGIDFRQPQNAPWSASSSRDIYHSPLSAHPTYPYLESSHAQMMESPPADSYHSPSRSTMGGRLPPNSMLLTPLVASGQVADSYAAAETYYDDKARSGHPSNLDQGSGDEF